jgi:hypothetical protein
VLFALSWNVNISELSALLNRALKSTGSFPLRCGAVTTQAGVIAGEAVLCLAVIFDEGTCRTARTLSPYRSTNPVLAAAQHTEPNLTIRAICTYWGTKYKRMQGLWHGARAVTVSLAHQYGVLEFENRL